MASKNVDYRVENTVDNGSPCLLPGLPTSHSNFHGENVNYFFLHLTPAEDKTSPLPLVPGVVTQIMAKNYLALPQPSS